MALYADTFLDSDGDSNGGTVGIRIPSLGSYDLNPRGIKIAQVIVAAGDDTGNTARVAVDTTPAATSDTDADIFVDTQETVGIFNLEADSDKPEQGIWVTSVLPVGITAFTASVIMNIGDTDDANGWVDSAIFLVTSTNVGLSSGTTDDTSDDFLYNFFGGKFYATSSGQVDLLITGADPAAGRLAVYASYFLTDKAGGG